MGTHLLPQLNMLRSQAFVIGSFNSRIITLTIALQTFKDPKYKYLASNVILTLD